MFAERMAVVQRLRMNCVVLLDRVACIVYRAFEAGPRTVPIMLYIYISTAYGYTNMARDVAANSSAKLIPYELIRVGRSCIS